MDPLLLTAHQIGERYGLHRNTLYKWEKQGLLHPVRTPGGRRRYRRAVPLGCGGPKADLVAVVSGFAARIYG